MINLITGGAGFIGSYLAEYLLDQGQEVIVLDDLSTGSFDNIAHLVGRKGFTYYGRETQQAGAGRVELIPHVVHQFMADGPIAVYGSGD